MTRPDRHAAVLRALLALSSLEWLAALALYLSRPSTERSAVLFGLSAARLGLAAVGIAALAAMVGLLAASFARPAWTRRALVWLDGWGRSPAGFAAASLLAAAALGAGGLFWLAALPAVTSAGQASADIATARAAVTALRPLLAWVGLVSVQALAGWPALAGRPPGWGLAARVFAAGLILSASALHWAILALALPVFTSIPGWYWQINEKGLSPRSLAFVAAGGAVVALAALPARTDRWVHAAARLLALGALGAGMIYALGFVEGQGLESLRLRQAATHHKSYALNASAETRPLLDVLRSYEDGYGRKMFLGTKPPGVLAIYLQADRLVSGGAGQWSAGERFLRLTQAIALAFPPLSFLVLGLIFAFSRRFISPQSALAPALLYAVFPNVILFALYLDQALYPALFAGGVLVMAWAARAAVPHRALWRGLLAGLFLYLAVFVTFSMVALAAFALALVGLDVLFSGRQDRFWRALFAVLGLAGGFAAADLVARAALQYDLPARYNQAMTIVHNFDFYERVKEAPPAEGVSPLALRLQQTAQAAFLNNVDFAAAAGFPVYLLALAGAAAAVGRFLREPGSADARVLAAVLAAFLGLNLFGAMRGESARLWLFWAPFFAVFAGMGLEWLAGERPAARRLALATACALQVVTLVLTYSFQDLVM